MSKQSNLNSRSVEAAVDLTATINRFVKLDSSGQMVECGVQGETTYGVLLSENINVQGKVGQVAVGGVARVVSSGVIGAGVLVTTGDDGEAEIALAADHVAGVTRNAAAAAGDYLEVDLDATGGHIVGP